MQAQEANAARLNAAALNSPAKCFVPVAETKAFLKKVTAVTVCTIAYTRKLFPEDSFGVQSFGGIQFKVLKDTELTADALIEELKKLFDAIDKNDIHKIELDVCAGPECGAQQLLEVWSIRFGFKGDPSVELDAAGGGAPLYTVNLPDVQRWTESTSVKLLRALLFDGHKPAAGSFGPLAPRGTSQYLVMRAFVDAPEERKPAEFELVGFEPVTVTSARCEAVARAADEPPRLPVSPRRKRSNDEVDDTDEGPAATALVSGTTAPATAAAPSPSQKLALTATTTGALALTTACDVESDTDIDDDNEIVSVGVVMVFLMALLAVAIAVAFNCASP